MSKGALLFAYNNPKTDYYSMAVATAKRIKHFLGIPVSLVTGTASIPNGKSPDSVFDKVLIEEPDNGNVKDGAEWLNKGRFHAWRLTPYDETLLIDVDYVVNSDKLLKVFDIYDDFMCHDTTSFLMVPDAEQEYMSKFSFNTLWATIVVFKKNKRTRHIFQAMEMIQKNYDHYANLHNFIGGMYRNDYALTLALRIVNGHSDNKRDIIPWNLLHVGKNTTVLHRQGFDDEFNTTFEVTYDNHKNGKIKKEYIYVKDTDFHMMNKGNFNNIIKRI